MKILVVTLMLIVVKGIEAHALPDERVNSDVAVNAGGGNSKDLEPEPEPVKPIMEIQNLGIIFENALENMTSLTRELQQRMETFGTNVEEQVRDKMTAMFGQFQGTIEDSSKLNKLLSFVQQLEGLQKNISQWDLNRMPVNSNQSFNEKWQQDLTQQMEQLQKISNPVIDLFHRTITEGVENLRKSISPAVLEIRKLVSESESLTRKLKET